MNNKKPCPFSGHLVDRSITAEEILSAFDKMAELWPDGAAPCGETIALARRYFEDRRMISKSMYGLAEELIYKARGEQ